MYVMLHIWVATVAPAEGVFLLFACVTALPM